MTGRKQKNLMRFAAALGGFAAYFASIYYFRLLEQIPAPWQFFCENEERGQTAQDYERVCSRKEDGESCQACAFWKKEADQTVENPGLSRACKVSVWKIRGSLEILLPPFSAMQEDDRQGCYLSEKAARDLFGGADVIGSLLLLGERRLTVRGLIKGKESLLAVRPQEQEITDRVTLEEQSKRQAESFQMKFQIPGKAVSSQFLEEILWFLILLFPIAQAAGFFRRFNRVIPERNYAPGAWLLGTGVWWLLLAGFLLFIFPELHIPETMIPDKWSDFQFWGLWWESVKEDIGCFVRQEKVGNDLARMEYFAKSAAFLVMSLLSLLPIENLWYDKQKKR